MSVTVRKIDKALEVTKALKWARESTTAGYSKSWLAGYEKAYEEVQNSLGDLAPLLSQATTDGRREGADDLAKLLKPALVKALKKLPLTARLMVTSEMRENMIDQALAEYLKGLE